MGRVLIDSRYRKNALRLRFRLIRENRDLLFITVVLISSLPECIANPVRSINERSAMSTTSRNRNPVEVLSEEFLERMRRGEAATPEEYAGQHPELADEILALFPALLMMEDLGDDTSDGTGSVTGGGGSAGATTRPAGRVPPAARGGPRRHGRGVRGRAGVAGPPRGAKVLPQGASPTPSRSAGSSARPARPRGCTIRTSCRSSASASMRERIIM